MVRINDVAHCGRVRLLAAGTSATVLAAQTAWALHQLRLRPSGNDHTVSGVRHARTAAQARAQDKLALVSHACCALLRPQVRSRTVERICPGGCSDTTLTYGSLFSLPPSRLPSRPPAASGAHDWCARPLRRRPFPSRIPRSC